MTSLKVIRSIYNDKATLGKLYINDEFQAYTLEDRDRDLQNHPENKIQGRTAIPEGKYRVIMSYSPHFKKLLPEILNVPGFEGIRIHGGNTEKDTEGCILVAEYSDMATHIWNCPPAITCIINILNSVPTYEYVYITIEKEASNK